MYIYNRFFLLANPHINHKITYDFKEVFFLLGKLIGEGYFSEVYEYGADKAIKLMRSCFSKEYVQSEYERLQEVHEKFQWSPAVYGIKEIDGRHGIIFDRAKGRPISDYVMRYVWNLKKYLMILLKYQLILHSIRTDKLPSYMDILKKNINRIPELFDAQKEFILD